MEFYTSKFLKMSLSKTFQFPTGWNSTKLWISSMTNKTRFNSQRDGILLDDTELIKHAKERFNSQRDGILLVSCSCRYLRCRFQFPTGWNSTRFFLFIYVKMLSFNSQRDGILQKQISLFDFSTAAFQFPTGWNSTLHYRTVWRSSDRFNSQRDGILLRLALAICGIGALFQFPTGWNSTLCIHFKRWYTIVFQFPTGWNSTVAARLR